MTNEPKSPAAKTADAPLAATATPPPPKKPPVVVAAADSGVPLFGGHRGGGKKRKDGLVAGSPEAKAADRKADAERKRAERAAKKAAPLPPPLPAVAAAPANPVVPLAAADGADVVPPAGMAVAPTPLFVAWSAKKLAPVAKLLTRIVDRLRMSSLMKRVRKLRLKPEQEREIERDLQFKQAMLDDFNDSLTELAETELNRLQVPGAQYSVYVRPILCGGELVFAHLNALDKLEKMIVEKRADELHATGTIKDAAANDPKLSHGGEKKP